MSGVARGGASVEPAESVGDPLDRVLECERVEVGDDRRHLHRHVVDIGAVDALLDLPQPLVGFRVGEDRFAERVHVDPHGIGAALAEMAGEPRVFGGEHDAAGLVPDAPHDQRHHERGQQRSDPRAAAEEHPIDPAEGRGRMLPHHGGEAARRPTGRLDAHDLVGEREQQLTSLRVREQPAEPVLPPTLGRVASAKLSTSIRLASETACSTSAASVVTCPSKHVGRRSRHCRTIRPSTSGSTGELAVT